jgi:hypothetical protein
MPARRIRKRLRNTKPRTHLSAPFRRMPQAQVSVTPMRRPSRPDRA